MLGTLYIVDIGDYVIGIGIGIGDIVGTYETIGGGYKDTV